MSSHEGSSAGKEPRTATHVESNDGMDTAVRTNTLAHTETVVHADGTVDVVDSHAMGGDSEGMPPGYFRSPQFIGTVAAQCFASICAYLGWVLPANTL